MPGTSVCTRDGAHGFACMWTGPADKGGCGLCAGVLPDESAAGSFERSQQLLLHPSAPSCPPGAQTGKNVAEAIDLDEDVMPEPPPPSKAEPPPRKDGGRINLRKFFDKKPPTCAPQGEQGAGASQARGPVADAPATAGVRRPAAASTAATAASTIAAAASTGAAIKKPRASREPLRVKGAGASQARGPAADAPAIAGVRRPAAASTTAIAASTIAAAASTGAAAAPTASKKSRASLLDLAAVSAPVPAKPRPIGAPGYDSYDVGRGKPGSSHKPMTSVATVAPYTQEQLQGMNKADLFKAMATLGVPQGRNEMSKPRSRVGRALAKMGLSIDESLWKESRHGKAEARAAAAEKRAAGTSTVAPYTQEQLQGMNWVELIAALATQGVQGAVFHASVYQ